MGSICALAEMKEEDKMLCQGEGVLTTRGFLLLDATVSTVWKFGDRTTV